MLELGEDLEILTDKKTNFENASIQRKKEKKNLISSLSIAYVALSAVLTLISIAAFQGSLVSILQGLATATFEMLLISGLVIPTQFKQINQKYPTGNISEIEQEMSELRKQLSTLSSKKNKSGARLENLQKLRKYQEALIQNILQEKSSVETLRAKVIEEYCNNNPELEEKIDKAYDEDVKAKVKVNK